VNKVLTLTDNIVENLTLKLLIFQYLPIGTMPNREDFPAQEFKQDA